MEKKQEITKQQFFGLLTPGKRKKLIEHFNTIYECTELDEIEINIVYLAWLLGEGHAYFVDDIMVEANEGVEFNEDDYEIDYEDPENRGGLNFMLTKDFYDLDTIYKILAE